MINEYNNYFYQRRNMSTETKKVEFVPLLDFEDYYEILNDYPYTIRRKSDHYQISEYIGRGYVQVSLRCKTYDKHRIIAKQFVPNSENLPSIDHKYRDRTDYHIENLRWCTNSTNQKNRSSTCGVKYTFVDEIDDDSIEVTDYGDHQFEDYYYSESVDKFYYWNGVQYRELHVCNKKDGTKTVNMVDTNKKRVQLSIKKFKRLYDLI